MTTSPTATAVTESAAAEAPAREAYRRMEAASDTVTAGTIAAITLTATTGEPFISLGIVKEAHDYRAAEIDPATGRKLTALYDIVWAFSDRVGHHVGTYGPEDFRIASAEDLTAAHPTQVAFLRDFYDAVIPTA